MPSIPPLKKFDEVKLTWNWKGVKLLPGQCLRTWSSFQSQVTPHRSQARINLHDHSLSQEVTVVEGISHPRNKTLISMDIKARSSALRDLMSSK
ncbi:hypothetical protein KEM48_002217 [Puccinia striiformis f. sp. tritici PST-130]|nr:hypothetical protein KEM48_002217 [Puccinia striiformis f. sp. tritici PST-130]